LGRFAARAIALAGMLLLMHGLPYTVGLAIPGKSKARDLPDGVLKGAPSFHLFIRMLSESGEAEVSLRSCRFCSFSSFFAFLARSRCTRSN
jgi:hypothetical protein